MLPLVAKCWDPVQHQPGANTANPVQLNLKKQYKDNIFQLSFSFTLVIL